MVKFKYPLENGRKKYYIIFDYDSSTRFSSFPKRDGRIVFANRSGTPFLQTVVQEHASGQKTFAAKEMSVLWKH